MSRIILNETNISPWLLPELKYAATRENASTIARNKATRQIENFIFTVILQATSKHAPYSDQA